MAEAHRAEAERDRRRTQSHARFELEHAPIRRQLPTLKHARIDDPKFISKAPSKFQNLAAKWAPKHGSALLAGPPGSWKTSALVALLSRLCDEADQDLSEIKVEYFSVNLVLRARWTSALALINAPRQHGLGQGEPPIVTESKRASVLFIDELGPPDRDCVILDVLDARYASGRPTLATTGASPAELRATYGGGVWRRLTEAGTGRLLEPK